MATRTPERIGRYEILRQIGRGAMGSVYLARDSTLGRLVALKTFRTLRGADDEELAVLRKRLLREAQSAGMLSHPNVITIYDVVEEPGDGGFYIAMEYVEGRSLAERLRDGRRMQPAEVADLVRQIAAALDVLHANGIVHRDVKPANILLDRSERVKITDFGVARPNDPSQTQETAVLGTPQYMAPEQIRGAEPDARTDVFALGVLTYEMLTGEKPFGGETITEVTHNILYEEPPPPDTVVRGLPEGVGEVLAHALAKEPGDRFASAGTFAAALARVCDGGPASTGTLSRDELDTAETAALQPLGWRGGVGRVTRRVKRSRRHIARTLAVLLLVGLAFAGGALFYSWSRPEPVTGTAADRSAGYFSLLREGQRRLATGDPEAAAILLATAERLTDAPGEARRLRREAERQVETRDVERRAAEARRDLEAGRYQDAIATARTLLDSDSGRGEGLEVLAAVEKAIGSPVSREPPTPPDPREEAVPPAQRLLELRVTSEVPRGTVALYADGRQVLIEEFEFEERRNVFLRRPGTGSFARAIQIPSTTSTLQVLVQKGDEAADVVPMTVDFSAEGPSVLEVTVRPDAPPVLDLRQPS